MEELLKEIQESLKIRKNGAGTWTYKDEIHYYQVSKGKGSKAYTIRRIDMLQDKLKELKKDLKAGKYDCKG